MNDIKPKFVIAQKCSLEHKPLLDLCLPNKQAYADHHGYKLYTSDHTYDLTHLDKWMKLEAILKCFEMDCDWIFWSDVDSVIMNFNITLESFICDKDIITTFFPMNEEVKVFHNYPFDYSLHAGNMLIKKSDWAFNFLTECYNDPVFFMNTMSEEAAMTTRYRDSDETRNHIKVLNLSKLCTIPSNQYYEDGIKFYKDGDFIIHFLGYPLREKIQGVMGYVKQSAIINNISIL